MFRYFTRSTVGSNGSTPSTVGSNTSSTVGSNGSYYFEAFDPASYVNKIDIVNSF